LVVEAQVAPHLIDNLQPGLTVDIMFPAFSQVTTPRIPGKLRRVAADVQTHPSQAVSWFPVLVEVTPEGLSKLRRHDIRSGMPAEIFIRTGERTALNYMLKPFLDRLTPALTEP
jgi:protease secretion system membrane fusion protein